MEPQHKEIKIVTRTIAIACPLAILICILGCGMSYYCPECMAVVQAKIVNVAINTCEVLASIHESTITANGHWTPWTPIAEMTIRVLDRFSLFLSGKSQSCADIITIMIAMLCLPWIFFQGAVIFAIHSLTYVPTPRME